MTVQHAPLGLDFAQHAGRIVESHVLRDRGMESGEVHLAEVDRVAAGSPLPAFVAVSRQLGVFVQAHA